MIEDHDGTSLAKADPVASTLRPRPPAVAVRAGAVALFVGTVVAVTLMLWMTRDNGPGVTPDSTDYLEAARNARSGSGLTVNGKPMVRFPPAYPALLAWLAGLDEGDTLGAGRLVAVLLFGGNLAIFCVAVRMSTERSAWATLSAMLLFLTSAPNVSAHAMVWSEPLFIASVLAALCLLSAYLQRPEGRYALLLAAALSAGAAMATRYVGVAVLPPLLAGVLVGKRPWKQRVRDALVLGGVASLPLTAWVVRNLVIAESTTGRRLAVHLVGAPQARQLVETMHGFVLPLPVSFWAKTVVIAVICGTLFGVAMLARTHSRRRQGVPLNRLALPALCMTFSITYLLLLGASISFFDANTPVDSRILLPLYLVLAVGTYGLVWRATERTGRVGIWYGFLFLTLVSIGANIGGAVTTARAIHRDGLGYASRHWRHAEVVSFLVAKDDHRPVYSNAPDVLRFWTRRPASTIPPKVHAGTRQPNADFESRLAAIVSDCGEGRALVAYLDDVTWRWYLPTRAELESIDSLPVLRHFRDGVVFGRDSEALGAARRGPAEPESER